MKTIAFIFLCIFCMIFSAFARNWSIYSSRLRPFYSFRMRGERIGPGKQVTDEDIKRAKSFGPNVCVKRIAVGFQTTCIIINGKYNCSMATNYRSVFNCCPGYKTVSGKSGCPFELYTSNETLIETAKRLGLNTLVSLIETAGLKRTLSTKSKFTLFAPSEKALKTLDDETVKKLTNNPKALAKVLLYHVTNGKRPTSSFKDNELVESLNSKKTIRVNKYYRGQVITANGVRITRRNIGASNGIIHLIDAVLMPPESTAAKLLANSKELSLFRKALIMSNIEIRDGDTIFAPTNQAFNNLDVSTFERLLKSPKCLKNLLLNHILPDTMYTTVVADESEVYGVRTREGTAYYMTNVNNTAVIDEAKILKRDIRTEDAVLHVIDKVLLPTSALTILEIAKQNGAAAFARLIKEVGLKSLLLEDKKFTLFAPSDEALREFIGNSSVQQLENITSLVKYHIVPGVMKTCNFYDDQLLDTLDGDKKLRINVYSYRNVNSVQGVCLKKKNCHTEACNGVVHVLSKVLTPPKSSLYEIVNSDSRFTAFAAALLKADLDMLLNETRPLTIFAPTNAAFSKITPDRLEALLTNPRKLINLMKYHIIHGSIFRCAIGKVCPVSTSNGRSVILKNSKGNLQVNSAISTQKEIVATNGIIYPVESVIMLQNDRADIFRRFWRVVLP